MIALPEIAGATLLALVCSLDRAAVGQFMLHRPLVAAMVLGLWLHTPQTALFIGVITELCWLVWLPVGGSIPPDDTVIALAATFVAAQKAPAMDPAVAVLAFFCAIPGGMLAGRLEKRLRHFNGYAAKQLGPLMAQSERPLACLRRWHLRGILVFGAIALLSWLLTLGLSWALYPLVAPVLLPLFEALSPVVLLLLLVLASSAFLAALTWRYGWVLFALGFWSVTGLVYGI